MNSATQTATEVTAEEIDENEYEEQRPIWFDLFGQVLFAFSVITIVAIICATAYLTSDNAREQVATKTMTLWFSMPLPAPTPPPSIPMPTNSIEIYL